jgi:hypothetical protein
LRQRENIDPGITLTDAIIVFLAANDNSGNNPREQLQIQKSGSEN